MRISVITFSLLLSALAPTRTIANLAPTPFDLLTDGSIVVPVTIGGTGPYRFVVDTGSSRTVISTRLWRTLRLPVVAQTRMVTPAGTADAYVVGLPGSRSVASPRSRWMRPSCRRTATQTGSRSTD